MTTTDRESITYLQRRGFGYRRIATYLGLPLDTVKSFCARTAETSSDDTCLCCGSVLEQKPGRKKKLFCSYACRMAWWKQHPQIENRKAFYEFTCAYCGAPFKTYGNPRRKYCCRACYSKSCRKGVPK